MITPPHRLLIRPATLADAEALATLGARTFFDTFAADTSPEDMALHLESSYSPAHQDAEIRDPRILTFVATQDQQLIAFGQLRDLPAPDSVPGQHPLELWRFYVDQPFLGQGVAAALFRRLAQEFPAFGADVIWLGVWEHNGRAQAFYRKLGFSPVGEQIYPVGHDPQRDLIMACEVTHLHIPPAYPERATAPDPGVA